MTVLYEKTSDQIDDELIARITDRHTNKAAYEKDKPVDAEILDTVISGNEEIRYYMIGTNAGIKKRFIGVCIFALTHCLRE